jgi:hypothetical protein
MDLLALQAEVKRRNTAWTDHLIRYAVAWLNERASLLLPDARLVWDPPSPSDTEWRVSMAQFARDLLAQHGHEMLPDGQIVPISTEQD